MWGANLTPCIMLGTVTAGPRVAHLGRSEGYIIVFQGAFDRRW
jgi:hypothetical protein